MSGSDDFEEPQWSEGAIGNRGPWTEARLRKIPWYKETLVGMYREGIFPSEAAQELDLRPALIREWRREDAEFNEACIDAESAYNDQIEKEAIRRAKDGVLDPVVAGGRLLMDPNDPTKVFCKRVYSDSLLMFILKGRRRETYGEKREIDATVKMDPEAMRDELARKFDSAARAVAEAGVSSGSDS